MPDIHKMNLNYLLNKYYYDISTPDNPEHVDLTYEHFNKCNTALTEKRLKEMENGAETEDISSPKAQFALKTVYPGLLIGIGNTHETGRGVSGNEDDGAEIKLGFTLDYVTGMPVIPGSSVKGVLRSAFSRYRDYVAEELIKLCPEDVGLLEKEIFAEGDGKVVFFDAIPIKPGKDGRILGLDNITPHPSPLKSPNPLTMLKVIPNVTFLFRFGFERWKAPFCVSADTLLGVFKEILTTFGVGAKTNVGFGALESANSTSDTTAGVHAQENAEPPAPKAPLCQWDGCTQNAPENDKSPGKFHKYCQIHFIESQKKPNKQRR